MIKASSVLLETNFRKRSAIVIHVKYVRKIQIAFCGSHEKKKPVIIKAGTEQRSDNVMPVAMHVHESEISTINLQCTRTVQSVQSVQVAHTNRP